MGTDPRSPSVHVDETAVDGPIRTTRISSVVSKVASVPAVRTELVARQRRIMQDAASHGAGVVAEGRDITTVVAPDADVRVLLLADEHARLARRAKELHGHSGEDAVAATRDQVSARYIAPVSR
jgi:cytidylate kinase